MGGGDVDSSGKPSEGDALSVKALLEEMIHKGASDLHLTVGEPPRLRVDGDLIDASVKRELTARDTLALAYSVLTEQQKKRFETDDELDFSFGVQGLSRFRGNLFKQRGCIAMALRQAEAGTAVAEICRKLGVSEQTFYRWKKKFGGMGVPELRELRQLRDENRRLKGLVADLSLDREILQEAVRKKW